MRIFSRLIYALTLLVVVLSLAGSLAAFDWRLELLSHLRPLYVLAMLPGFLLSLSLRQGWLAALFVVSLLLNFAALLPLYIAPEEQALATAGDEVRLTHFNLDRRARGHEQAFAALRERGDEMLMLQEITPSLARQIVQQLPNYQVRLLYPHSGSGGSALLLKRGHDLHLDQVRLIALPEGSERRLISAHLRLGNDYVRLLGLHVMRSRNAETSQYQVLEFKAIADWAKTRQAAGEAVLIIGDFNTTPWSQRFQQLLKDGDLHNGQRGFGLQGTWPAWSGLPLLPIDLCIHSKHLRITDYTTDSAFHGDHR